MTIVEKIISSVQVALSEFDGGELVTFPVYYHDIETLNLIADSADYPCAFFQLLTDGTLTNVNAQQRESVNVAIFFVEPSEFDFDAIENEEIIDRCKGRAAKWLQHVPLDRYIEVNEVVRTQRVYERFDGILTGYGLIVTLTELQGVLYCAND